MIDTRNPVSVSPRQITTDRGEAVTLVKSRSQSIRRTYGAGDGLSGQMSQCVGIDASGTPYIGKSWKRMRVCTNDAPAAKTVADALSI